MHMVGITYGNTKNVLNGVIVKAKVLLLLCSYKAFCLLCASIIYDTLLW